MRLCRFQSFNRFTKFSMPGRFSALIGSAAVLVAAGSIWAADPGKPARLLVVTVTAGFRHASIATAEPVLEELGRTSGLFHVDFLRMPPGRLAAPKAPNRGKDTTDEAWQQEQVAFKAAQEQFKKDEIYQYDPRYKPENLRVLVSLDMAASTPKEPWHVPVAWVRDYGQGRVFATNFGHNDATWNEPMFKDHMRQGIAWALGRIDAQATPNPDAQAAEYVRSVVAAAAAATGKNADDLRAKADAKITKDPTWATRLRPLLLELQPLAPAARGPVYEKVLTELEKP